MYKISEIEGIGPSYAAKLAGAKITNTDHLLAQCGDKKGRTSVSESTGVSEKLLLRWANMADLMRVKGIARQFAELLEAAGVDTVKELRNRNSANLSVKMAEVNSEKNLAKASPSAGVVAGWIDQAKGMEPRISH